MDSAGASTPAMVADTVKHLTQNLNIPVGFHAHNNLGLAVGNSLIALENGVTIIDATLKGFGAGAGNCQLEAMVTVLKKMNMETGIDLYKIMDVSEKVVTKIMVKPQEINTIGLMGGLAGVFSVYALPIKRAAEKYGVDARDIYVEVGKRKIVGGQEDMVTEVAIELSKQNK